MTFFGIFRRFTIDNFDFSFMQGFVRNSLCQKRSEGVLAVDPDNKRSVGRGKGIGWPLNKFPEIIQVCCLQLILSVLLGNGFPLPSEGEQYEQYERTLPVCSKTVQLLFFYVKQFYFNPSVQPHFIGAIFRP